MSVAEFFWDAIILYCGIEATLGIQCSIYSGRDKNRGVNIKIRPRQKKKSVH